MSQKYLVHYPNGFKSHISRVDRDMQIATLERIGEREYRSKVPISREQIVEQSGPYFYQGQFVTVWRDGSKSRERMESPRGMVNRLRSSNQISEVSA